MATTSLPRSSSEDGTDTGRFLIKNKLKEGIRAQKLETGIFLDAMELVGGVVVKEGRNQTRP